MRIFDKVKSLFTRHQNSNLATPEQWFLEALLGGLSASGVRVTPQTVLGVSTVLACVNAVSRTMSSVPLKMYRRKGKDGKELATEHPLYNLLSASPIPGEMTSASFVRAVQANATLRNISHALIVRNGLNVISELVPIEPVDINMSKSVDGYRTVYKLKGKEIPESSLLTIRGLTFNGIFSADPLRLGRDSIGLAIALQDNAARFFANGSRPGGILSHPNSLSEEAQERLKNKFTSDTTGKNAYSLMVLEEGLAYHAQREANQDSQFDESRARQDKAIARIFGVPQSKIGILDDAHYNNVEHETLNYLRDTILPWTVEWEQALNMKLLTPEEQEVYYFKFNLSGLMRGDTLSRYQANAIGRNWGWLNVDEIRAQDDLDPLPDGQGQIYLQPLNMQEAGQPLDAPTATPRKGEPQKKKEDKPTT